MPPDPTLATRAAARLDPRRCDIVTPVLLGALLTSLAPRALAQTFFPSPTITALSGPTGPAAAGGKTLWVHDFTGDGVPDVLSDPQYTYVVATGRGDGTFGAASINTGIRSEIFTTILGVRDVNGDGLDEVFSYHVDNRARWSFFLRSWMPTGSLVPIISVPAQLSSQVNSPDRLFVEDIDGDGRTELLQLPNRPGPMRIWRFTPTGMVDVTPSPAPTYDGRKGALGDVNGDGLLDVVAYHSTSANPHAVGLWLQTPGFGFAAPRIFAFPTTTPTCQPCPLLLPRQYVGGDVDGDGLFDFVVTGRVGATFPGLTPVTWTFHGSATGTLVPTGPEAPPGMGTLARRLGLHDLDLDGSLDLVYGASVHRLHPRFASTGGTIALDAAGTEEGTLADLDNDGDMDLVQVLFPPGGVGGGVGYGLSVNLNPTIQTPACTAPGGLSPHLTTGAPAPGNASFAIGCDGLAQGTVAVLCVSLASASTPVGGCVLGVDLTSGARLLPAGLQGWVVAAASGTATFPLPLPPGTETLPDLWAQWIALDPLGPGQRRSVRFSLSDGRRIRIW